MAAAVALRNTDIFGLPSVTGDGAILQAVEVPAGAPLATIAQVARLRLADLRAMNPEYLGPVVPATGRRMLMRFPGRSVAHVSEGLLGMLYRVDTLAPEKVPEAELPSRGAAPSPRGEIAGQTSEGLYYRWRDGDTLPAVASRFQTNPAALAEDNALRGDDLPAPGALIFVRRAPSAAPSSPAPPPAVPKGRGPRRKKP
jgi:hypothetical protein